MLDYLRALSPLRFIDDLLHSMFSSMHSFVDDAYMSSSFSSNSSTHVNDSILLHRSISASLLTNDLTILERLAKVSQVLFKQSKPMQVVI